MKNKKLASKIKNEYAGRTYAVICGLLIVVLTVIVFGFIFSKGMNTFIKDKYPISKFLFSTHWRPDAEASKGGPSFGVLMFIEGSVIISIGAVILSTPISLGLAIFMNYISPKLGKKILQPALELFVGIPSVVYGWVGISFIVPMIRHVFGGLGFSVIAGILVLSVMILPTITSLSSDALSNVSRDYLEASYGLGATRWQTIYRVIVPASSSGVLTGIVFGLARAFGEALAVQMVIGNAIRVPDSLTKPASTLTSILTMDMANTMSGTAWNDALWSMALLLLLISLLFIIIIRLIGKRGERN